MDKSWMLIRNRFSKEYIAGVNMFMGFAYANLGEKRTMLCPCVRCMNVDRHPPTLVTDHLYENGINLNYKVWVHHGESYSNSQHVPEKNDGDRDETDDDDDEIQEMFEDIQRGSLMEEDSLAHEDNYVSENVHEKGVKTLEKLLKGVNDELFPGCKAYTMLTFLIKLLHVKVLNKWSNKSFTMLLGILKVVFSDCSKFPKSHYEAKSMLRELGLGYTQIHVCKYDCALFWKEYKDKEECPICGESRWRINDGKGKKIPHKILRHFPLKLRLQRLFISRKTGDDMRWHKEKRVNEDNVLRHPADGLAWKDFDKEYPWFAKDSRNVRLALTTDGFNPYGNMSTSYSMWPVILIPYNLPPWKCMKESFFIMSLLIPGPKAPGKDFDVYLEPLIDELKELWYDGAETWDASVGRSFKMHAMVLWTINDFPAYAYLSGWSTKGYKACPTCNEETDSQKLRSKICYMGHRKYLDHNHHWRKKSRIFNGKVEKGVKPREFSGDDVLEQLTNVPSIPPGKHPNNKKRKRSAKELNWSKKSIFFELPYWHKLKMRHNLDVMHIEKNICDNLLGTLLDIDGKTKDTYKARQDLADMKIRRELHLMHSVEGKSYSIPPASYTLSKQERKEFCEFLKSVKFPDGYTSNISRCVNVDEAKVSGMKSHDCHVMLQRLLPIGMRGFLSSVVHSACVELGEFFKSLCCKTLDVKELERMEKDIVVILCKLEQIFPPAFFDIMVHLAIHLPREAILGGPLFYRWMYPIERNLGTTKEYVTNKARPEGSIAEGYIANECLTFCSMYLHGIETKFDREERNYDGGKSEEGDEQSPFFQHVRPFGASNYDFIDPLEFGKMHWYMLDNCNDVHKFMNEHKKELETVSSLHLEKRHRDEFPGWFKRRMMNSYTNKLEEATELLYILACGPLERGRTYKSCIVNSVRFHVKERDNRRLSQNSGVMVQGDHEGNLIDYYGILIDVIELAYIKEKRPVFFKCEWFNTNSKSGIRTDTYFTSVNVSGRWYKDDPYVLASQVQQVFYLNDTKLGKNWQVVQKFQHRHLWNIPENDVLNIDQLPLSMDVYQENDSRQIRRIVQVDQDVESTRLCRDDVEPLVVDSAIVHDREGDETGGETGDEDDDTLAEYCSENEKDDQQSFDDSDID